MINLIFILLTSISQAKTIRVAVIDTGLDFKTTKVKICDSDHGEFTGEGFKDTNGHGTNISNLIDKYTEGVDYCQIIIKYKAGNDNKIYIEALKYTIALKPDVINISSSGRGLVKEETRLIKEALNNGIKIVASAGNNGQDLNKKCNVYPACSDNRVIKVGNLEINPKTKKLQKTITTNYGEKIVWEMGTNAEGGGITLTGTSQATAIHTGKLIKKMANGTSR